MANHLFPFCAIIFLVIFVNLYKNTNNNKRYYTLDYFYKEKFGCKVAKICIDAPFTCPNIDGTRGFGGCIYCVNKINNMDINMQIEVQKKQINKKWKTDKYIIFLQSHTNTYASVDKLKELYEPLLKVDGVIGLSVATRADSISYDCMDYLEDLSKRTYLTIELGLQTIHDKTSKLINRCHSLGEFEVTVRELRRRNINVVVHIINGLPFETKEMMIENIRYLNKLDIQGIKIHMLFIDKEAPIKILKFKMLSKEEYVEIVCDQLENLNPDIVVHRLTGDGEAASLIKPLWSLKKVSVLNDIDKLLSKRNTFQGFNKTIQNMVNKLIVERLNRNDLVIDATVGNGHDTEFILRLIPDGHLYGFDIQKCALDSVSKRLGFDNYTFYNKSHEFMLDTLNLPGKISLVIFNLGYLPGGDKNITTHYNSTIKAIKDALVLLNDKGLILITVYPGHDEGKIEAYELDKFLVDINHKIYKNTDNEKAPYLIVIEKNKWYNFIGDIMKVLYNFLYVVSVILIICFCAMVIYDYINYDSFNTSFPFYAFIINKIVTFLFPSLILFILSRIIKRKIWCEKRLHCEVFILLFF